MDRDEIYWQKIIENPGKSGNFINGSQKDTYRGKSATLAWTGDNGRRGLKVLKAVGFGESIGWIVSIVGRA